MAPTPRLVLPLGWETRLTVKVPSIEAPFPQISSRPKYSPDFSGGDELGEVGAGQGLHAALEHAHHHGQHPEMGLAAHEHGKNGDAAVGQHADADQAVGVHGAGKATDEQGRGEGHDLGDQQGQQQTGGVKAQGSAVGSGHVDNGVDAVNIEEGQDE